MGRGAPHFARCGSLAAVVAAAAPVIAAASAVAAAVVAAPGVAAATADHDDNQDDPQAGVVSVAKAHICHLALGYSMRRVCVWSLTIEKIHWVRKKYWKNTGCFRQRDAGTRSSGGF